MPDQDIFENKTTTPEGTPPVDPNKIFADQLNTITNNDGNPKYDSVEKALEALKASQQFIETLKTENSQTSEELQKAKAELEKMGNIDDFVSRISNTQTEEKTEETPQLESLSEQKVQDLVQKTLQERDTKSQQERNLTEVIGKLSDMYGEKAEEHVAQRAKDLGVSVNKLKQLAQEDPQLALAALDVTGNKTSSSSFTPRSTTTIQQDTGPKKPEFERFAVQGGLSNKELADMWRKVGAYTHDRLGVENSQYK